MDVTIYVGIDPGASGGLATIDADLGVLKFRTMPATEREVWDWISDLPRAHLDSVQACIELVSGYVGEAQPGSSAFKFGANYGMLRMALVAAGIPFEAVRPQDWQKSLDIPARRKKMHPLGPESKQQWKQRLKSVAEGLYPAYAFTLATADAVLLAHVCRMRHDQRSK